ncbi:WbqC family protein, partial [Pseudomonas viridiflava]|uniref:WbqC family protein n=1 Tax=Pseudomonas viridiflava TaxID=33069 RepID=UPI001F12B52B
MIHADEQVAREQFLFDRSPVVALSFPRLEWPVALEMLALYAENTLRELCAYLQIDTPIIRGSDLRINHCTDRQDRVIRVAHALSATSVLNPLGGMQLYDRDRFARNGLLLRFFSMRPVTYPQLGQPFVSDLSIIDVLMFN